MAIRLFNEKFGEDEIRLEHEGNRAIVLVREIDLDKVKEISTRISHYTEKTIFQDMIASIEGIKSYGIKGIKRNYVDYNKERKVKDRKNKEKNRNQFYYAQNNPFNTENIDFPEEYQTSEYDTYFGDDFWTKI